MVEKKSKDINSYLDPEDCLNEQIDDNKEIFPFKKYLDRPKKVKRIITTQDLQGLMTAVLVCKLTKLKGQDVVLFNKKTKIKKGDCIINAPIDSNDKVYLWISSEKGNITSPKLPENIWYEEHNNCFSIVLNRYKKIFKYASLREFEYLVGAINSTTPAEWKAILELSLCTKDYELDTYYFQFLVDYVYNCSRTEMTEKYSPFKKTDTFTSLLKSNDWIMNRYFFKYRGLMND